MNIRLIISVIILTNQKDSADELMVSYYFPPAQDASGNVMAKRIIEDDLFVDVVCTNTRDENTKFSEIVDAHIGEKIILDAKEEYDSLKGIKEFAKEGLSKISKDYERIYSRSYAMSNHFLALEYSFSNPEVFWTAEFSDPVYLYLYSGKPKHFKEGIIKNADYINRINERISRFNEKNGTDFDMIENPTTIYYLTEYLPFIFADRIIFTNENQKKVMLSPFDENLREQVLEKSSIKAHPTLPGEFYHLGESDVEVKSDDINIAYFGGYYPIRHFESLFYAFESMNHRYKDKIKLYFFISDDEFLRLITKYLTFRDNIIIKRPQDFIEFLNSTLKFDILLINDAITRDTFEINPFLPSKFSDYLGSGKDIWAIAEKGSILDKSDVTYKSYMHDYRTSVDALAQILKDNGYEDKYTLRENYFEDRITGLNRIMKNEFNNYRNYDEKLLKLKKENEKLKKENEKMRASNSWKLTKPLRNIKSNLK